MKYAILLIALISSLLAQGAGELSFYILKEGRALANQSVLIINQENKAKIGEYVSDSDGYLHALLPVGAYQLQVVAKDGKSAQAFVRKNFIIEANRESQIILSLKSDNSLAFTDVEAPKAATTAQAEVKKIENGTVQIALSSSEDKKPIEKARAFVKGMDVEMMSDAKGNILLTLPAGEHTLSIIHSDYSAQTVKVTVTAKENVMKFVELSPASMELEEFVVLAPNVEGSIASVVAEEKNSDSIASVIGSEQMSKQGDSNAASALKRVAGITLMGGKYIYVRGLGDRYSSTELNSMSLPSPNPIKRTVPLDMFPSSVIGSLQVQKSFSSDITGAFGGGYVNIRTKQTKDEDYVKLKMGVNAHSTMGKEATSYQGSKSDWSGYDSSYRPFSSTLNSAMTPTLGQRQPSLSFTNSQMQDFTTSRDLSPKKISVPMGREIGIEASQNLTISDDHEIGVLASYGYKNDAELREYTSYDYLISSAGVMTPTPDNTVTNNVYKDAIQHGGMLNISYSYENFDAKYTKLYVLNTLNQTRDAEGTFGENNSIEHQNYLEWQERELSIDQLSGGIDYTLLETENRF
ncbi:MAG: carboxypeptidase-like regulatory domain-containing protein, partial [Epsilonproteobacteria bacterium]|nr:carboxypeptidase-like regulatory domain-containing protein [Campylobacterota bacterium]